MDFIEFSEFHRPAVEGDEVRHNVILSVLNRGMDNPDVIAGFWSLG